MSRYRPKPKLDDALEVVRRAEEAGYFDEPWQEHRKRIEEIRRDAMARRGGWAPERGRLARENLTAEVEARVAALLGEDDAFARRVVNTRMIRGAGRPGAKRN